MTYVTWMATSKHTKLNELILFERLVSLRDEIVPKYYCKTARIAYLVCL